MCTQGRSCPGCQNNTPVIQLVAQGLYKKLVYIVIATSQPRSTVVLKCEERGISASTNSEAAEGGGGDGGQTVKFDGLAKALAKAYTCLSSTDESSA